SIINKSEGQIRVDSLAYEVGNSKRNLERKFKDTTGLTPKKFIDNTRFQFSLKRLSNNRDLQEVTFLSGYYDLSHFVNDFKKITGKTPEKYCF
ncbi:MAG: helix-turn-helix transcriptional regulator, partial [Flammeovirgaceae bacterium]|nr:helix-turn-helix transcriptional regulator [Flammeovirgaceae bacterium]